MKHPRKKCTPPDWSKHIPSDWKRKRWSMFVGLLFLFGMMTVLLLGAMGIAGMVLMRMKEGSTIDHRPPAMFLLGSCSLVFMLPLLAIGLAGRAFRRVATPLSDVMSAADAVADGDLTTRVPETGKRGQFAHLASAFNHMIIELQRADEQRRNLTADVAHELRTPLHIIQGNLEGILDGVYDPSPAHIEATLDETRTLARLVGDLHTLSKAEAGQLSLQMESLDVIDVLRDVRTSFSGQAESKGVALRLFVDESTAPLMIEGDAGRLDQVFSNLVANGLRHTPAGGRIEMFAGWDGGETAVISIHDTGEGISPEELPYIFDRFWRGDVSRSHAGGAGAGLGLAIAKQLVEAHQGTIVVESVKNEGSMFTVSLPIQQG